MCAVLIASKMTQKSWQRFMEGHELCYGVISLEELRIYFGGSKTKIIPDVKTVGRD